VTDAGQESVTGLAKDAGVPQSHHPAEEDVSSSLPSSRNTPGFGKLFAPESGAFERADRSPSIRCYGSFLCFFTFRP
jgi:hypothetical protein